MLAPPSWRVCERRPALSFVGVGAALLFICACRKVRGVSLLHDGCRVVVFACCVGLAAGRFVVGVGQCLFLSGFRGFLRFYQVLFVVIKECS